eukprot:TRINITY_DN14454_c0_g1_i1.p1 TRINITY_DN14454_c0_g1~~TRINITY_DN14454_c0_g1_i1.p1  ORF type:complete len:633 (+),score=218.93 TRINITY_DN14454_c0_g1_i1:216-1901(+)
MLDGCTDTKSDLAKQDLSDCTLYLLFCQESIRTKDSFVNAADYLKMKCNDITNAPSLFKRETVVDVIKMFTSYKQKNLFAVRSGMEGICRCLDNAFTEGCHQTAAKGHPVFLNAGDGRHTHPTLEYVDVFTLLEVNNFDRKSIHIALVGDLLHGRTAHSKVDGLKIFEKVAVDLIAPKDLAYPVEYKAKMAKAGFRVREFATVEDYLNTVEDVAKFWSFSRLQVEKLGGDASFGAEEAFHEATAFKSEWTSMLPQGARFLQTLPRDRKRPLVPYEFDTQPINAYEMASSNGYWVRIVLMAMLMGGLGEDFHPMSPNPLDLLPPSAAEDQQFMRPILLKPHRRSKAPLYTTPFVTGIVIDHIARGAAKKTCWATVNSVRNIMGWLNLKGTQGVYQGSVDVPKGVITLPEQPELSRECLHMLAALAPGCTVNTITDGAVVKKLRLAAPARIFKMPNASCANKSCISHEQQQQPDVFSDFMRVPFYLTTALNCQVPAYEIQLKGELEAATSGSDLSASLNSLGDDSNGGGNSPRFLQRETTQYLYVCRYCMWPHFYKDIFQKSF